MRVNHAIGRAAAFAMWRTASAHWQVYGRDHFFSPSEHCDACGARADYYCSRLMDGFHEACRACYHAMCDDLLDLVDEVCNEPR